MSTGLDLENVASKVMGVLNEGYLAKVRLDTHRGVAPPRARRAKGRAASWAPIAIREMLRNPIYWGERIWNRGSAASGDGRSRSVATKRALGCAHPRLLGIRACSSASTRHEWVKDHETGMRRRFDRPESEWVRQQDEAWRVVSDELWQAAQDVRGRRNERHVRDAAGRIRRTAIGNSSGRKRLLSGFFECGKCGGSFHALSARFWGCSWRKNRGACSNDVKIPEPLLERAVLGAVSEALDEEIAVHALEVAIADLRERIARAEPTRLEEELAGLDVRIARALDLAIELGDLAEAKDRLRALRAERERKAGELDRARVDLPTAEELMPRLREKLGALEATLRADVALSRLALGTLLGDRRIRVYRDRQIEGLGRWPLKRPRPRGEASEPRDSVVAGA
jgi:hypothetical protein